MNTNTRSENPFRPGAGHMPPYLAGRTKELQEFEKLLQQTTILENAVLTGLRGVGKTVLLESFRPLAIQAGWLWVGTDLSESSSVTEESLATRLITDLSLVTSSILIKKTETQTVGFNAEAHEVETYLDYNTLVAFFQNCPGLVSDKLKATLEFVAGCIPPNKVQGVIFAYDEAQTLADHAVKEQYPLSLLLDTFQSIQRKNIPFMLVLTGLPTLFPKLVEARTYAERMFHVIFLDGLSKEDSAKAITVPVAESNAPFSIAEETIGKIVGLSGGYPYFIQFICREVFDIWLRQYAEGDSPSVPENEIVRKLDSDFFAGRWARATDRQRTLLAVIASLPTRDDEFTVQEIVEQSKACAAKPFSSSHVNQMLSSMSSIGLIYKNRHGKYSFAVPLMGSFISRQDVPDVFEVE
jgi:hypothetical protein